MIDKIFEKFGLYDLWGVWGPGAVFVTWSLATLQTLLKAFGIPQMDDGQIVTVLYTVVTYACGVVLHEIGNLLMYPLRKPLEKKLYGPNGRLKDALSVMEQKTGGSVEKNLHQKDAFTRALAELKYTTESGIDKVEKYHAIYGMARSVCAAFVVHAVLSGFFLHDWNLVILDMILAALLLNRAIRYRIDWVVNVCILNDLEKKGKA